MGVRRGGFAEQSPAEEPHADGGAAPEGEGERACGRSVRVRPLCSAKLEGSAACQEKWEEQRTGGREI